MSNQKKRSKRISNISDSTSNKLEQLSSASVETSGIEADDIAKAEQIAIKKLISQALYRHKNDEFVEDKKIKFKELTHLASMCEEYLSSFALLGYTLNGEQVVLFNRGTSKDEAALNELFRVTFLNLMNNQ